MQLQRTLSLLGAAALLSASSRAQTVLSGALSDSTTGPLLAGVVYHIPGGISVGAGQTLTIQAGAKLKFGAGATFDVSGLLHANGTAGSPIYMTSLADDTVGGDTNGNGPSSGSAGDWTHVRFYGSSAGSSLQNTIVRFGGGGGWTPLRLEATVSLSSCTIENGANTAIDLTSSAIQPTIANCTIRNNAGWAIAGARFSSLANLSGNGVSGNSVNGVLVSSPSVNEDANVPAAAGVNGVIAFLGSVTIPAGRTLTLGPGVLLKSVQGGGYEISGVLNANGTAGQPVVFTTFADGASGRATYRDVA